MASLLELPQPIRFQILRTVLSSEHESATSLKDFHDNDRYQRLYRHGYVLAEEHIERQIRYPSRIYLPFEGVLRVNRQLRSEMKQVISEFTAKKVNCKLDIVVECENKVYPTWVRCPARSPHVQRLDVDVRLLGCVEGLQLDGEECRHYQERGRCITLAFAIVAILARFVERGARFEHARGEIAVHTIVLNFKSRVGGDKFLELVPVVSAESDDWDTDTLVDGEGDVDMDVEAESDIVGTGVVTSGRDLSASVDGPELLRTVNLVLKPLCRDPQFLLARRRNHFSTGHLTLIRRNVRRILLHLDGKLERRIYIKGGMTV
jgi:hypothetical protein